MAWPNMPQSLEDFPLSKEKKAIVQAVDPATASALCHFVYPHIPLLELITGGDPAKEHALGGLLIDIAQMSANVRERYLMGEPTP